MTASARQRKQVQVLVVSDATGITAERVISAVLVQFRRQVEPVLQRRPQVKTARQLMRILDEAEESQALVIYSFVSRRLRALMREQRRQRSLVIIDLLGPLLRRMQNLLQAMPMLHPGLLGTVGDRSLRMAEAIDFTLRHDDGHGIETIGQADLIILGVSRTSKTPTSLYISCNHHLKVANVPIIYGVQPPAKIFRLKRPRLVGFVIAPEKLALLRRQRYRGNSVEGYTEPQEVARELEYSRQVFTRLSGIRIFDVTSVSIEELANQIV